MEENRAVTPESGYASRPTITAAQKQQLIDNLQNEITSRARKLRAQYALHARSLRDRLEMRINRIPHNVRHMNIAELIDRYSEDLDTTRTRPLPLPPTSRTTQEPRKSPVKTSIQIAESYVKPSALTRGIKRLSNEISMNDDKENTQVELDLPKKRVKTASTSTTTVTATAAKPTANAKAVRTASRKINPSAVLSPKSHNSRTLPYSPIKPAPVSPVRSGLARSVSPLKPSTTSTVSHVPEASMPPPAASRARGTKNTTQGSIRGKASVAVTAPSLPLPAPTAPNKPSRTRAASNLSDASATSASTTIVKKKAAANGAATAAKKTGAARAVTTAAAGATKRAPAAKKAPVPVPAPTANPVGRTLRSRK